MTLTAWDFVDQIRANPHNVALLERLPTLGLPHCFLTAGCLFQTVWNSTSGRQPNWGIKDYDVFYFDDTDLSWDAENREIERVNHLCSDLPATVALKNQARVHLWYQQRFGAPYPRLKSACDGIDRYLVACTCVGIEMETGTLYAPNGFDDMSLGILKMNPVNPRPDAFLAKARQYQSRWPWLSIIADSDISEFKPSLYDE